MSPGIVDGFEFVDVDQHRQQVRWCILIPEEPLQVVAVAKAGELVELGQSGRGQVRGQSGVASVADLQGVHEVLSGHDQAGFHVGDLDRGRGPEVFASHLNDVVR